jgi:SAM-dependent methyltransferase
MNPLLIIIFALVLLFCLTALTGAPFVPSKKSEIQGAFKELYPLGKHDLLIDLGSGNGKVLIEAHNCGAKSIGIELNPILAFISKLRLFRKKNIKVVCRDFFHYDFPAETTVVYVFADGRDMPRVAKAVEAQAKRLHKPIYLISHAFPVEGYKTEKEYRAYYLYKIKEKK